MNTHHRKRRFWAHCRLWLAGAALLTLALPFPAMASLGGGETSIQTDQTKMRATGRTTRTSESYTVHEITTSYGTTVREYVAGGKVFGVAWQGPFLPDFQQILGSYYEQFTAAAAEQRSFQLRRSRNASFIVSQTGLVVHSGGHNRAYFGQAYLPDSLPENVSAEDIR